MNVLYNHRTRGDQVEAVHILGIADSLRAMGHQVTIVSPPGVVVGSPREKREPEGLAGAISRKLPEFCFELMEILYNRVERQNIRKEFRKRRYDVVYERYALLNWATVSEARRNGVPVILEINYTSYTKINRTRSRLLLPLAHLVDRYAFRRADGFMVVSTYLKDHLVSHGVPEDRIVVIPNAADPDAFRPNGNPAESMRRIKEEGNNIVGFVGGFHKWHGVDLLVDTVESVRKEVEKTVYVLIGDGPQKASIQRNVENGCAPGSVVFIDRLKHDAVPEYLESFDIAVLPDSNAFGSPMKILEYMAAGKAVVAPRLGPLLDIIDDGNDGFLFTPGDRDSLSKKLIYLLKNDELRRQAGILARKKIISKHNWMANAGRIVDYYEQRIGKTSER